MSIQLRNLLGSMSLAAQNQIIQLPGSQLLLGDSKGFVDSQSGTAISIEDAFSCVPKVSTFQSYHKSE